MHGPGGVGCSNNGELAEAAASMTCRVPIIFTQTGSWDRVITGQKKEECTRTHIGLWAVIIE